MSGPERTLVPGVGLPVGGGSRDKLMYLPWLGVGRLRPLLQDVGPPRHKARLFPSRSYGLPRV